jgi:hypothetical protein
LATNASLGAAEAAASRADSALLPFGGSTGGNGTATTAPSSSLFENAVGGSGGPSSFLGRYRYLSSVENAVAGLGTRENLAGDPIPSRDGVDGNGDSAIRLCPVCVQRVERALAEDADRLEHETRSFREAATEEEARSETWRRALESFWACEDEEDNGIEPRDDPARREDGLLDRQAAAFRDEIEILRRAVAEQEQEIGRLARLRRDQVRVLREMRRARSELESERNDLEIEARAFDNDHDQLSRALADAEEQARRLSSPCIRLLSHLYELTVDNDRGLRYPLINGLRLAYRPKGDMQWDEIQAAWSLAAQLLLSVATVFNFQSSNWKIVPLSHCAKLIYTESMIDSSAVPSASAKPTPPSSSKAPATPKQRSMVFNLGHPRTDGSRALAAWNSLLHKIVQHATVQLHRAAESGLFDEASSPSSSPSEHEPEAERERLLLRLPHPVPPFETTPSQIGDAILARLNPKDDAGWSKVIHYATSNLLWLADCASIYVRHVTTLQASASSSSSVAAEAAAAAAETLLEKD